MNSLTWNIIEVNVLMILLFLAYLTIKKRLSHKQQRACLLGMPLFSVLILFVKNSIDFSSVSYGIPVIDLNSTVITTSDQKVGLVEDTNPFFLIYVIGCVGFGLMALYQFLKVWLIFYRQPYHNEGKIKVYDLQGYDSFSFFNRIQIAPNLSTEDRKIVLEHEKLHVAQKHSYDLLSVTILQLIFWYNPLFFFIKREVVMIHEFDVDALMYQKHKVTYMRFLVNYALRINHSTYLLTSSFYNQLTLKKRIKHMKTKSRKQTWIVALLPLIGLSILLMQCTKSADSSNPEERTRIEEPIYDVVDEEPEFKGGVEAMNAFIVNAINYPKGAEENNEEGIVYVSFVITSNGDVTKVKVEKGVSELLDAESVRVVSAMPRWVPGKKDGKNVSVKFTLPINYRLS